MLDRALVLHSVLSLILKKNRHWIEYLFYFLEKGYF